jgi:hypothetical protein
LEDRKIRIFCTYELNGTAKIIEVDELLKVRQGFWVDDSGNFCHTSTEAQNFIMPSMIREIRKGEDEQYDPKDTGTEGRVG